MAAETSIEWTDRSWNPVRGCSRVSPGCDNCYAMGQAHRFSGPGKPYEGLTVLRPKSHRRPGVDWSGRVRLVPEMLDAPLRWRKPRRVFVNSMSDLFHESLSNEEIAAVFGVMAAAPQHTFQVLTKRAKRMRDWFGWVESEDARRRLAAPLLALHAPEVACQLHAAESVPGLFGIGSIGTRGWPVPNVWLGVSAEDQQRADERIPDLLATPAAVRGVSLEPLLGPVDLRPWLTHTCGICRDAGVEDVTRCGPRIDWVIVGSESGPGARPMRIEWAESLRDQCAAAGVPFFTKQIATERDRKGGNPEHWPGGPWPRQWPAVKA